MRDALVVDKFIRHPDVDVKVSVAFCFSEITRISAQMLHIPYDDEKMKVPNITVFSIFTSPFITVYDDSSKSFNNRVLETVAKVRSCVIMLDLECDGLVIEMFQHFFSLRPLGIIFWFMMPLCVCVCFFFFLLAKYLI